MINRDQVSMVSFIVWYQIGLLKLQEEKTASTEERKEKTGQTV